MRRFCSLGAARVGAFLMVCILTVVSICTPGLEVEQHYCIHRIGISHRFTHCMSVC